MVFSSLIFLFLYLPIVLAVYYLVPVKLRNIWLFVVNFIFYAWGEPVYVLLMVFSITLNYFAGLIIEKNREHSPHKTRTVLTITIILNLALLGFFKYYDLFAGTFSSLTGISVPVLGLTLPIGISFYTFQTMSYPIDIYRGDASVQKNYISFGTFVALFPQLIAGPIVRYKDLADQLDFRANSITQFSSGVCRFSVGLAKKVLLANSIGTLWDLYSDAASRSVCGAWLGILAFSLQIYFDFSGYSDMAIGLGRMLGFEFLENFNYPYIAKSITDFWRRWHISLSTWFRDYVYIPLGGNRKGKMRMYLNLLIVWSLTGFWHGANWTFLLWGLYYAVFLITEKSFLLRKLEKAPSALQHLYAVVVVVCGWVLFDLPSLSESLGYYGTMFGIGSTSFCGASDLFYLKSYIVLLIVCVFACTPVPAKIYGRIPKKFRSVLSPILILAALIMCTAYLVNATYNPFLYFRF